MYSWMTISIFKWLYSLSPSSHKHLELSHYVRSCGLGGYITKFYIPMRKQNLPVAWSRCVVYASFKNVLLNFTQLNYNNIDIHSFSWILCGTSNSNFKYRHQAFLNVETSIWILVWSVIPCLFLLYFSKKKMIYNVNGMFSKAALTKSWRFKLSW